MKKVLLLGLFMSVLSCEKNIEDKMEQGIKDFISQNADDPKSYKPVSFKMVKDKSSVYLEAEYSKLQEELAKNMELENSVSRFDKTRAILKQMQEFVKKYKPKNIFTMNHVFKINNQSGAPVLDSANFSFDENFKVINSKKIELEM